MMKKPRKQEDPEVDPKRGDEILKRILRAKPKQHKDIVAERKAKREQRRK